MTPQLTSRIVGWVEPKAKPTMGPLKTCEVTMGFAFRSTHPTGLLKMPEDFRHVPPRIEGSLTGMELRGVTRQP
jgi:hypothetical protein